MNNKKSAKELILNSRGQLIGRYGQAILVVVIVGIINFFLGSFADYAYTGSFGSYLFRLLILIVIDLLLGVLFFGQDRYFLNLVRGVQGLSPADLFYGIKNNADKAIGLQAVITLVSVLVALPEAYITFFVVQSEYDYLLVTSLFRLVLSVLLFVVRLFFGLSFCILADHPEYGVLEILKESNRLMTGNRLRLVSVTLRMVPFILLGFLSFGIGLLWPAVLYSVATKNLYLDLIGEEPFDPLADKEPEPEPEPDSKSLLLK